MLDDASAHACARGDVVGRDNFENPLGRAFTRNVAKSQAVVRRRHENALNCEPCAIGLKAELELMFEEFELQRLKFEKEPGTLLLDVSIAVHMMRVYGKAQVIFLGNFY